MNTSTFKHSSSTEMEIIVWDEYVSKPLKKLNREKDKYKNEVLFFERNYPLSFFDGKKFYDLREGIPIKLYYPKFDVKKILDIYNKKNVSVFNTFYVNMKLVEKKIVIKGKYFFYYFNFYGKNVLFYTRKNIDEEADIYIKFYPIKTIDNIWIMDYYKLPPTVVKNWIKDNGYTNLYCSFTELK